MWHWRGVPAETARQFPRPCAARGKSHPHLAPWDQESFLTASVSSVKKMVGCSARGSAPRGWVSLVLEVHCILTLGQQFWLQLDFLSKLLDLFARTSLVPTESPSPRTPGAPSTNLLTNQDTTGAQHMALRLPPWQAPVSLFALNFVFCKNHDRIFYYHWLSQQLLWLLHLRICRVSRMTCTALLWTSLNLWGKSLNVLD